MKLKKSYASKDTIPAGYEALFTEKDGKWVREDIELEEVTAPAGSDGKEQLKEFRTNNIKLTSELGDVRAELGRMQKQFKGVDPEQFAQFQEQLAKISEEDERKLIASGNINEVVKRRTARAFDEKNAELKTRGEAYDKLSIDHTKLTERFATVQAGTSMSALISEAGLRVRKGAQGDLDSRIAQDWTVDSDGQLVARNKDLVGESGAVMIPSEYVKTELLDRRSFFFEPAGGGNAQGNAGVNKPGGKTISGGDPLAFGRNIEDIASGKVHVTRE